MKKNLMAIFVVFCSFFIFSHNASATTLRDLYTELNALEKTYKEIQNQKTLTQKELNNLNASIISAENEIKQAQIDIDKAQVDIEKSELEIADKKEETNQMLVYLQMMNSGGNSSLEYILDAESYTEFIYRYAVISQMSDYNQKIIKELNTLIERLNSKKVELADKQKTLTSKKSELQSKYAILQTQYKDEHADGLDLADQIAEQRRDIKRYEQMGCKMNDNINSCNGMLAVDGWVYPMDRFWQSSSYAEKRENERHYAVDLAVSEGTPVKAVANGEVVSAGLTSTKSNCYSYYMGKYYNNCHCGGVVVQIRHNYKGTEYVSLYMHLLTYDVKAGDKVVAGKVIGTSGGGRIEAEKWHDYCTAGAHLHFAMAYGNRIGYSSQKGSTFDPVKFFPAMKGEGSTYNWW